MKNNLRCLAIILPALCTPLSANLVGTFNMTGTITVTASTIAWASDVTPFTPQTFTLSGGTGSFATANGQNNVFNLNNASDPVGTLFPPTPFIAFPGMPGSPTLDINFIYQGLASSAACGAPAAVGQTCTPANPGGSPFTFTNNPPAGHIQSTGQFVFSGVSSDGMSTWTGVFTSQFGTSYQQQLAAFGPGGSGFVTDTYSGTITVLTPEPSTALVLPLGLGMLGLAAMLRKRVKADKQV